MKTELTDSGVRGLSAAIVLRAILDYDILCSLTRENRVVYMNRTKTTYRETGTKNKTIDCAFSEIEDFLENRAYEYTDLDTTRLLTKLKREREFAEWIKEKKPVSPNKLRPFHEELNNAKAAIRI